MVKLHWLVGVILLVMLGAEGDVLKTREGVSHEGKVEFLPGELVRMATSGGEMVEVPLEQVESLRLLEEGEDKSWMISGTGVFTSNGSFLARSVVALDEKVVTFEEQTEELLLTTQNTSAVFFQRLRSKDADALRFDREGVFLRSGDFMAGRLHSVADGKVTIDSLLLGRKSFSVENEAMAVVLRAPIAGLPAFSVLMTDGSRLRGKDLELIEGGVVLDGSPYREFRVAQENLLEIRRESAPPLMVLFRERWLALDNGRLAVAALGDDVSMANLMKARAGAEKDVAAQAAVVNEARAELIRRQQIHTRLRAGASRAKANVVRYQGQAKNFANRIKNEEGAAKRAREDIEKKDRIVKEREQMAAKTKAKLQAVAEEDPGQRRIWEQQVRNAEQQVQSALRVANQARANHQRYVGRIKGLERSHRSAEDNVRKAEEQQRKEQEVIAKGAREMEVAGGAYQHAQRDLKDGTEELRRIDILLSQRRVELEEGRKVERVSE